MSFLPKNSNPYSFTPSSPVPSYQSSSQSSAAAQYSPGGGNSSTTESVSTAPSQSTYPSWADPSAPQNYSSKAHGALNPPFSSAASHGTHTGGTITIVPPSPSGSGYNGDEDERSNTEGVEDMKSTTNKARERGANFRALALLEATSGQDVQDPNSDNEAENVDDLKSDLNRYREEKANSRALALLDSTYGKEVHQRKRMARSTGTTTTQAPVITAQQAAIDITKQRAEVKSLIKDYKDILANKKHTVALIAPQPKEKLATSTRKPRELTADDVRDPETVAGMKSQLDIDREKWARKRALMIMKNNGCIA